MEYVIVLRIVLTIDDKSSYHVAVASKLILPFSVKIQEVQLFDNHIAVYERENGLPKVTVYRLPAIGESIGQLRGGRTIDFIDPTYAVDAEESEFHSSVLRFHYSSMRTPPSVYDYDMDSGVSVLKKIKPVSCTRFIMIFGILTRIALFIYFYNPIVIWSSKCP